MTNESTKTKQSHQDNAFNGPHETLGQYLKRARIDQQKTLDSVTESTCIHIATIQALEEDDYEKLPAEVFVRGFIKIYATHLNLDPNKALELYQPVPLAETNDFSKRKGAKQRILPGERLAEASPFTTGRQILVFALICLFVFVAYKIMVPSKQPPADTQETTISENTPLAGSDQLDDSQNEKSSPELVAADSSIAQPTGDDASPDVRHSELKIAETKSNSTSPSQPAADTDQKVSETMTAPPKTPEKPEQNADTADKVQAKRVIIAPYKKKISRKSPDNASNESITESANDTNPEPVDQPSTTADSQADQPTTANVPPGTKAAPAAEQPTTQPATKPAPYAYILKAKFSDLTWMEVSVDNGSPQIYTFRSGSKWEWQARENIKLNIGNAGGVILKLNNKTLPPLGETGKSVEITLPAKTP